jgi:hypothetical protein
MSQTFQRMIAMRTPGTRVGKTLPLLVAGLGLLWTASGCVNTPAGPTCMGFSPSYHHRYAQRVIPCDPSQGYRTTCWHDWQDGNMADRAGDLGPDPAAGAAGKGEATIVSPPDNPPAEVISLPPGVPPGNPKPSSTAPAR